jgi:putative transposase
VFGVEINKDVVRGVLGKCSRPTHGSDGPSWLTFFGHAKDSLWSVDLFRCESLILKTYCVMVVVDQFTRRIIGFAVQAGVVDGAAICRMFNQATAGASTLPHHLSTDHDPPFQFHRWRANLRILDVTEVKTVPHVPLSHPFVERLIGTVRRELLDHVPFWGARDLEPKLLQFKDYYNDDRTHASLEGITPTSKATGADHSVISLTDYDWQSHCRGLYQLPIAA